MNGYLRTLAILIVMLSVGAQAHALAITPTSGVLNTSRWVGDENSQSVIDGIIAGIMGPSASFLYKQNSGVGGTEEGPLAGSYETTFSNTTSDPSDALIHYTGGSIVDDPAFLLVKDGNHSPAWYLFNLTLLGWNGTDDLILTGFWPAQGAISHVSLYGGTQPVPEPSSFLLLGTGLIGLAGWGRKRFRK